MKDTIEIELIDNPNTFKFRIKKLTRDAKNMVVDAEFSAWSTEPHTGDKHIIRHTFKAGDVWYAVDGTWAEMFPSDKPFQIKT